MARDPIETLIGDDLGLLCGGDALGIEYFAMSCPMKGSFCPSSQGESESALIVQGRLLTVRIEKPGGSRLGILRRIVGVAQMRRYDCPFF